MLMLLQCNFLKVAHIRLLSKTALKHCDAGQRDSAKKQLADNYYQHVVDHAFFISRSL